MEDATIKLVLKYNIDQQSARISSEESHRLFFLDIRHSKTILKNEYGIEIGKLVLDRTHLTGSIEIEGKKYDYALQQINSLQLVIAEHSSNYILISCELSPDAASYNMEQYTCLLLGLCSHLFALTIAEQAVSAA